MDDPRGFGLPQERGYGHSEQDDIEFGEFRLEGWIWEANRGDVGLEEHDPLRRIGPGVTRPGARFLEVCCGRLERGGRLVRGLDGTPIAWQRAWSDIETVGAARQRAARHEGPRDARSPECAERVPAQDRIAADHQGVGIPPQAEP